MFRAMLPKLRCVAQAAGLLICWAVLAGLAVCGCVHNRCEGRKMNMADTVEHRFGRFSWRLPKEYAAVGGTYRVRKVDILEVPEEEARGEGASERLWEAHLTEVQGRVTKRFPSDEPFFEELEVLPGLKALHHGHVASYDHRVDVLCQAQDGTFVWFQAEALRDDKDLALERLRKVIPAYRAASLDERMAVDQRLNFITSRGVVALPYQALLEGEERTSAHFSSMSRSRRLDFKCNALEHPLDPDAEDPVSRISRKFIQWSGMLKGAELVRNEWTQVLGLRGAESAMVTPPNTYMEWSFEKRRREEPQIRLEVEAEFEDAADSSEKIQAWDGLLCGLAGASL